MMVWLSESEGTNVVCNAPPQRSKVSLRAMHDRLVEGKEWKVLRACRGQGPDAERLLLNVNLFKVSALWVHHKT